jgi:hypothetical protein
MEGEEEEEAVPSVVSQLQRKRSSLQSESQREAHLVYTSPCRTRHHQECSIDISGYIYVVVREGLGPRLTTGHEQE